MLKLQIHLLEVIGPGPTSTGLSGLGLAIQLITGLDRAENSTGRALKFRPVHTSNKDAVARRHTSVDGLMHTAPTKTPTIQYIHTMKFIKFSVSL